MSFNPNIPLVTDPVLQSYFQLRANFQAINDTFAVNHGALNGDPSKVGAHTTITFQPQISDPSTNNFQVALYNKLVSSIPEIFFRPSNSQTTIQMTYPSINNSMGDRQYSFVAGPFVIYFGLIPSAPNGTMVTLLPNTNLIYVNLTVTHTSSNNPTNKTLYAIPTSISANTFVITHQIVSTNPIQVFYLAVGLS